MVAVVIVTSFEAIEAAAADPASPQSRRRSRDEIRCNATVQSLCLFRRTCLYTTAITDTHGSTLGR